MSAHSSLPSFTVVVGTRDRPRRVQRAVESILKNDYPNFSLVVVDQSGGPETAEALSPFRSDPRFHMLAGPAVGVAAARNQGAEQVDSDLIAFTDDDCEVSPDWLACFATAFELGEEIGIVLGTVEPGAYDRSEGMILGFAPSGVHVERRLGRKASVEGVGACMGMRRSTWNQLAGLDPMLGAGSPFRAGEDTDAVVRALLAGIAVCEHPAPSVTHWGFRAWSQVPVVIDGYMFGLGAVHAKMVRLGGRRSVKPMAELGWRWLAGQPVADLNHLPSRFLRVRSFLRGFREGWRTSIDPATGHFMSTPAPGDPQTLTP